MTCLYVWLRQEVQTLLWQKCIKSYFKRILQKKDKFKKVKKSIIEFVDKMTQMDFSTYRPAEIVDFKINKAKELFSKDFKGTHEATRYIYTLFSKVLSSSEFAKLRQFNLSYSNSDDFNLMAIYSFDELGLYYSFSNELGFNKVSPQIISGLLKSGWKTNSNSIQNIFDESIEPPNPNR